MQKQDMAIQGQTMGKRSEVEILIGVPTGNPPPFSVFPSSPGPATTGPWPCLAPVYILTRRRRSPYRDPRIREMSEQTSPGERDRAAVPQISLRAGRRRCSGTVPVRLSHQGTCGGVGFPKGEGLRRALPFEANDDGAAFVQAFQFGCYVGPGTWSPARISRLGDSTSLDAATV